MGRQGLVTEEFRQSVVRFGETGSLVEGPFRLQDVFAETHNIVTGQVDAEPGVDQIDQGRQAGRIIEGGKGDKEAHARRIDGCGGNLQIPGEFDLPHLRQRIDGAADLQDIGGDGIAHGMIGTLGGGRVGDPHAFDGTWIVGRDRLVLDHRHPGHAKGPADGRRTAADNPAKTGSFADLVFQDAADSGPVAERQDARLHRYTHGDRGLNGINPQVVHQGVGLGDMIQVVDTAVGPHGPDRFVLEAGGLIVFVDIVVDLRTLDDTTGMAAVFRFAATFHDLIVHGLAGDLVMARKLTGGEIACRQSAGLVDDIDQDIGAVLAESLTDRMIDKRFRKDLVGGLEFFRIGNGDLAVFRVDGDELDPSWIPSPRPDPRVRRTGDGLQDP